MVGKLSARQQAQLSVLQSFPPKLDLVHRLIEEMSTMHADDAMVRRLARLLDEMKGAAIGMGLTGIADVAGMMGMLARRGGGLQMKLRGLREGLAGLKINFEGAYRAASTPEETPEHQPPSAAP